MKVKYDEPPDYYTHPFNKPKELPKKANGMPSLNNLIMNKKELKKFEDMAKSVSNLNEQNFNAFNQTNNNPRKGSKIILDPININQNKHKKMEVSFKATLEITDLNTQNIQIKPNINNISTKWKPLDKIVENGGNDYEEN
jgi:hypothetical protein